MKNKYSEIVYETSIREIEKLKKEYYKKPTRKAVFEEVRKIFLNGY